MDSIVNILVNEIHDSFVNDKNVYLLSALKKRFIELASQNNIIVSDSYKSSYLKVKLENLCPDFEFHEQPGDSYLVCQKEVTHADAI